MKFRRLVRLIGRHGSIRVRFSQYGEDTMIRKLFSKNEGFYILNKKEGFYIDVGAHHPFRQSNTAYLWCLGWNGVNVDASARSIDLFRKIRPEDTNICCAVVPKRIAAVQTHVELYSAKDWDLSATVSADLAAERGAGRTVRVPCTTLRAIVERSNAGGRQIDFLNVDIEGMDEEVFEDIADWPTRPQVVALETYAKTIPDVLKTPVFRTLTAVGYDFRYQIGLTSIYVLGAALPNTSLPLSA